MDTGRLLEEIGNAVVTEDKSGFKVGDTVIVTFTIFEAEKEVEQRFKGILIADKGKGINRSITVRHLTGGVGVERVFPVNAPMVKGLEVVRHGNVRRAKLYYIRDLTGKAATQVKEKRFVAEVSEEEPA